jgi:hypothetical protein
MGKEKIMGGQDEASRSRARGSPLASGPTAPQKVAPAPWSDDYAATVPGRPCPNKPDS